MSKVNLRKAAGCVILKGNSILLLHRIDKDWLELPGGKTDTDEEANATAVREAKEELLCEVEIVRRLGSTVFESVEFTLDYTWFLVKPKSGQIPRVGEPKNFDKLMFIKIDELRNYNLSTNMQRLIEQIELGEIDLSF